MNDQYENPYGDSVDFLIVSVITGLEYSAIIEEMRLRFGERSGIELVPKGDGLSYIEFTNKRGMSKTGYIASIYESGNVSSATEVAALLQRCRPGFAALCGIGGNVFPDRRKKGDVVFAKGVIYDRITRVSQDMQYNFRKKPDLPQPTPRVYRDIERFKEGGGVDFAAANPDIIQATLENGRGPAVEGGNVYCCDMVVDCTRYRDKIQGEDIETRVVEMEAAGFLLAVLKHEERNRIKIPNMIVRGISDDCANKLASEGASEIGAMPWRAFAAKNASRFLWAYLDQLDDSIYKRD